MSEIPLSIPMQYQPLFCRRISIHGYELTDQSLRLGRCHTNAQSSVEGYLTQQILSIAVANTIGNSWAVLSGLQVQ